MNALRIGSDVIRNLVCPLPTNNRFLDFFPSHQERGVGGRLLTTRHVLVDEVRIEGAMIRHVPVEQLWCEWRFDSVRLKVVINECPLYQFRQHADLVCPLPIKILFLDFFPSRQDRGVRGRLSSDSNQWS